MIPSKRRSALAMSKLRNSQIPGTSTALWFLNVKCRQKMNPSQNKIQIVEIGEANFESEVLRWKQQPLLVAFSAAWSRPCQILDSLATRPQHHLAFCSRDLALLNSDEHKFKHTRRQVNQSRKGTPQRLSWAAHRIHNGKRLEKQ